MSTRVYLCLSLCVCLLYVSVYSISPSLHTQVQTNADARVYYCLVQNRNTGSSVQPTGEQVASTSVPYSSTGIPGALACGAASTADSQLKTVSIRDRKSKGLAECVGRVSDCLRCPAVSSETSYRLYLAVGYPEANWELKGVSESSVLSVETADVTPPRSRTAHPSLPRSLHPSPVCVCV